MRALRTTFRFEARWVEPQRVMMASFATAGVAASFILAPGKEGAMGAGLAVLMVAIAAVDARHLMIPDGLSAAGVGLALLRVGLQGGDAWLTLLTSALLRAAIVAALFWAVRIAYRRLRGREGLGLGDAKLAGVAGAWLGWTTIPLVVEIAALSAIAFYLLGQLGFGRRMRVHSRIPFGAFLAPAIWFGWAFEIVTLGRL